MLYILFKLTDHIWTNLLHFIDRTMKLKTILFVGALNLVAVSFNAQAICIKNDTDFSLYYEIHNQNTGCSQPKVKFYKGVLERKEKKCYAHTQDDPDWVIYRHDQIEVYKIDKSGAHLPACNKLVPGIINTLEVSYLDFNKSWWCLDRTDYED